MYQLSSTAELSIETQVRFLVMYKIKTTSVAGKMWDGTGYRGPVLDHGMIESLTVAYHLNPTPNGMGFCTEYVRIDCLFR